MRVHARIHSRSSLAGRFLVWIGLATGFASAVVASDAFAQQPEQPQVPTFAQRWMYDEQALLVENPGDPSRLLTGGSTVKRGYRPEDRKVFRVSSFWVPESRLHAFVSPEWSPELRQVFRRIKGDEVEWRFLVHPESGKIYTHWIEGAERAEDFWATPTSSSRTLLAWLPGNEDRAFFAKLSLDRVISTTPRSIKASEAARSVGVTNILSLHRNEHPASFRFLPETLGLSPLGMERGAMIVREIPEEIRSGREKYVPFFSLYADPPDGGAPRLARMIQTSGMSGPDFLREKIIRPYVDHFFRLALDHDVIFEDHGQNLLLGVDGDDIPTGRFLHRDMGGAQLDLDALFAKAPEVSRKTAELLPHIRTLSEDYAQQYQRQAVVRATYNNFAGGILYDIDQRLKTWAKRGWIPKSGLSAHTAENIFQEEMRRVARKRLGRHFNFWKDRDAFARRLVNVRKVSVGLPRDPTLEVKPCLLDMPERLLPALFDPKP